LCFRSKVDGLLPPPPCMSTFTQHQLPLRIWTSGRARRRPKARCWARPVASARCTGYYPGPFARLRTRQVRDQNNSYGDLLGRLRYVPQDRTYHTIGLRDSELSGFHLYEEARCWARPAVSARCTGYHNIIERGKHVLCTPRAVVTAPVVVHVIRTLFFVH